MSETIEPRFPLEQKDARTAARHRKNNRLQWYGRISIGIALSALIFLLAFLMWRGWPALWNYNLSLDVVLDEQVIDPDQTRDPAILRSAHYGKLIRQSLQNFFPEVEDVQQLRELSGLMSIEAAHEIRRAVQDDPSIIGTEQRFSLLLSDEATLWLNGQADQISDRAKLWLARLDDKGRIKTGLNLYFFSRADSREPEMAGVAGSFMGSLWLVLACLVIALPMGVMAAVYLEECAPKNAWVDALEVNINNLAAVPSIIYGLLGLVVYLQVMELPRSSALVGGATLALLILPTLMISTRSALRAVPLSIREAALGLGASKMQMIWHHVVPLALPGIMTGVILGVARALGETAPLLMIGMVAFIADIPTSMTSPATAMPVQIYLWSDSPELAFAARTSLAIVFLLMVLLALNAAAIWLRRKSERRW